MGYPQPASWPHATAHSTPQHRPPLWDGESIQKKVKMTKPVGLDKEILVRKKRAMHISKAKQAIHSLHPSSRQKKLTFCTM